MLDFVKFGKRVREVRLDRGLTLEQASELCEMSSKGLENIELGLADPKLSTVLKISAVFNIDYSDFVETLEV